MFLNFLCVGRLFLDTTALPARIAIKVLRFHALASQDFAPPVARRPPTTGSRPVSTRFQILFWQHITFTMPGQFWDFFWVNRYLMNKIPIIAANIIKKLSKQKGCLPGIFLAIHTFGRDLKRNIHLHLSTTIGGLSLSYDS